MPQAILHPAWVYDCSACGMQQVVLEKKLDPEVCKALAEHLDEGVQPYGTVPDEVTCEICGAVASVIVEGEI